MNEKISLQDLSVLLAEKAAITKKEAEMFLREYFEVMNEELIKSGLLKIKDLGTFKLSLMEDRESIDVTTGERVLIPAHYKAVFTPDKKMAETINEPFAFFETIEIEESVLEELELFSEEDTSEESESILDEEGEIDFDVEGEIDFKEEQTSEENEVSKDEPLSDEEFFQTDQADENEKPDTEKEYSGPEWGSKRLCLNCYDLEAHRIYRKKYFQNRKKLNRQKRITYVLFFLLMAALGFIVYLTQYEKDIPSEQSPNTVETIDLISDQDSAPEISETLYDSVIPAKKPVENAIVEDKILPITTGESKQVTILAGHRLTSIAEEEYGDKSFWIYIYLENKAIIPNPNVLPVGVKISLPHAEKYGIDSKDPASVKKAKDMAAKNP